MFYMLFLVSTMCQVFSTPMSLPAEVRRHCKFTERESIIILIIIIIIKCRRDESKKSMIEVDKGPIMFSFICRKNYFMLIFIINVLTWSSCSLILSWKTEDKCASKLSLIITLWSTMGVGNTCKVGQLVYLYSGISNFFNVRPAILRLEFSIQSGHRFPSLNPY